MVLEVKSGDTKRLMEVLGQIIEKQSMSLNPLDLGKGNSKIELSAWLIVLIVLILTIMCVNKKER